jgi:hypothetical protein
MGDGPQQMLVSNRNWDYPSTTQTDPCVPIICGDLPHVNHVCKRHRPGVVLSGGMQRYEKCGHLHGKRTVDIIVLFDTLGSNVVISTPRNVDKFEVALHACHHPCRVAGQFLTNIFLKRGPLPAPHFLDLCVGVA